MHKALEELIAIRTANATGFTVEQVRTLNRCEAAHDRAYEAACRQAARFGPVDYDVRSFEVKVDERLKLPRVTYFNLDQGWMEYEIAVRADGTLDRTL